ncbi:MAG TPA: hypothetical protein PLF26_09635 [Blastocatellia bacterium]|nr:hypothetical protein [Blastocatellia bacterium]
MKVLQNQHERLVRCQRFEGVAHFPQHPFTRCSEHFAPERFTFRRADK